MSTTPRLVDLWERSLYRLMRWLPVELTSAIGSFVVRLNVKLNRADILAGARHNLKLHDPSLTEPELQKMVWRFLDNVGRVMAEFAILDRLIPEGRVELAFDPAFMAMVGRDPLMAIVLHTGNWEVIPAGLQSAGLSCASFYEPPQSSFQREVAENARTRFGLRLLAPTRRGIQDAITILKARGCVALFGDEARHQTSMAPLFGRKPHDRGNLAIVARLARRTDAHIVTAHCERLGSCNFRLVISKPQPMPAQSNANRLADVAFLNALIEPIVSANIDRWYFLDDSRAELEPRRAAADGGYSVSEARG